MKRISLFLAVMAAVCAAVAGDSSGAASNYPSPLRLRSIASSVTGSWVLNSSTSAVDATTSNVSINNAVDNGWYVFPPGAQSTTRLAVIPTTPDGTGWIVDPAGGASGFPAGTWTFRVKTSVPGALDPGTALLTVGMWKGTISGGTFTPVGPALLAPTDDPGSQDLRSGLNATTSASYTLPKFSLGAGQTLFVELWRHQVAGISDPTAANRTLVLAVNDGISQLTHPAADSIAPTHSLSVTSVSGKTAFKAGSNTLYYLGSSAGSFKVKDTITDSGSGPLQVTYPLVSTSGWTHPAETVTAAPSFTSSTYSWTAGSTTSPGAQSIIAEDKALQTATATLTLTNDTTGPTGQSVSLSGGPNFSTLSVPLTLVKGTDAGAGVDGASGLVERAAATATNGICGTFGPWAPVTLAGGADTSVVAGNCYRYRYTISDLLGNASSPSVASADAVIDTSATTTTTTTTSAATTTTTSAATTSLVTVDAPTELTGAGNQYYSAGTVWFQPGGSGSFTLNATAQSGVASVTFPDVSATSGWAGSTGGTDTTSPYASPAAYTWTAGAAAPGAKTVLATTASAQTSTAAITISADSAAPTGQTITVNGGPFFATNSVPLTISRGTDAGAGVDPAGDVVERATAPLRNGLCGTFGPFSAVTLVGGADNSVTTASCYRWQLKVTDYVGNVSTASVASADAKVDTTPPMAPNLLFTGLLNAGADGNAVYYQPSAAGSFTINVVASDPESGVVRYSFPTIPGFTQVGTGASRTYNYTSPVSPPVGPLIVTATNPEGFTSPGASFTVAPDPRPPTLAVRCNGAPCLAKSYLGPVTVTFTGADRPGSGLDLIRFTTNGSVPTKDGGFEYTSPFTVRSLTHLTVRAFDRAGNASSPLSLTVRSLADRLVFGAPARLSIGSAARYLEARVSSTRRAHVLAVMTGPGLKAPGRWRFILEGGTWMVQLRLPETIERGGAYTVRWTVSAGTKSTSRITQVTLR